MESAHHNYHSGLSAGYVLLFLQGSFLWLDAAFTRKEKHHEMTF